MLRKIAEIVTAWVRASAPTGQQETLAQERLATCQACPFKRTSTAGPICGKCGCPLSKKVYSPYPGYAACPDKRWSR